MRALITGGAGFIGSHLSERLLKNGDQVMVIDDLSTGNMENIERLKVNPSFGYAIETIHNEAVLDRLTSECDIIYHLAAAVGVKLIVHDPVHVIETNVVGTEIVLKTAKRYNKKVLLVSTSEVYGKKEDSSFREDDVSILGPVTNSRWSYACSKMLDEFLALAYYKQKKLPVTICRLFNTVGPRQTGYYGMVVPTFVRQALSGEPLTVYGDGLQSRCFSNVSDIIEAMILMASSPKANGEIFNLGDTHEITILDLAKRIIELSSSSSKITHLSYKDAYEEGFEDMRHRKPNIEKAMKFFSWKPHYSLDDTLKSVISHERQKLKR